ncbi:MAG: hypothetical protein IPM35_02510 [Myxococcales bacterium]|nr:hypothetical protein [Myxococcales bacterium]
MIEDAVSGFGGDPFAACTGVVTIARSRSGFRRVPASEVAAVAPEDEQPEDDEPADEHQHLTEIRSTAGPVQVAGRRTSPAPGREGPSLLGGRLREVEARRAAAQAAVGGDALTRLVGL